MSVSILLSDRRFSVDNRSLSVLLGRVLKGERAAGISLNVIYCSDNYMTELNRRFHDKSGPTDVLAFEIADRPRRGFIGEVYINLQQAKRQAGEYGVPYIQEVRRLTVHGVLHLLGYRDKNETDRQIMWSRQEGYL